MRELLAKLHFVVHFYPAV